MSAARGRDQFEQQFSAFKIEKAAEAEVQDKRAAGLERGRIADISPHAFSIGAVDMGWQLPDDFGVIIHGCAGG